MGSRKLTPKASKLAYMKQVVLKQKRKPSKSSQELEQELHQSTLEVPESSSDFFSSVDFQSLDVCDPLKKALAEQNFQKLTTIQARGIPAALRGHDILGAAKTGSGKTLSFLIPAIDLLYKSSFRREQGSGVIIITPTRELALQIYNVATELLKYMTQSHGLIMGGTNMKTESYKLCKHVNLLVATPGRLLDHLLNTKGFKFQNLLSLIIDEADAILKQGFEEEMNQILNILPKERQTILYSATQTKKVEDLSRVSLKDPVLIGLTEEEKTATVSTLEQGYVVVPPDKKFLLLFTFLKKNQGKKMMVFFSSCNSVKYHSDLLNYVDVPVMDIHGKQKQQKRSSTYLEFCRAQEAILLCTDVAARGLDIPAVDWIIQYDPPDEPEEYIHRVGRTARVERQGKALLFLLPEELGFLRYLKQARVPLNEFEFGDSKLANIQTQLERLIDKNYHLHKAARDGYKGYLLAYSSHHHKEIFDVGKLDLQGIAKAFGLTSPPMVNLNVKIGGKNSRKPGNEKNFFKKSGHSFSNRNPQGVKQSSDTRQFSR